MKLSKSLIFLGKSFLGNLYRHLAIFTGHTGREVFPASFVYFWSFQANNTIFTKNESEKMSIQYPAL